MCSGSSNKSEMLGHGHITEHSGTPYASNPQSSGGEAHVLQTMVEGDGSTKSDHNRPVGFMDFPGEIRNRIYDFAAEDNSVVNLKHAGPPTESTYSKSCRNRKFVGLTMVSRQIRSEFRPIYMQAYEFRVNLRETERYLKDFYPDAYTTAETALGRLTCIYAVQNHGGLERPQEALTPVDVLPMLRASAVFPGLEVRLEYVRNNNLEEVHDYIRLMEACGHPDWLSQLSRFSQIWIQGYTPRILNCWILVFREQDAEPWMPKAGEKPWNVPGKDPEEFPVWKHAINAIGERVDWNRQLYLNTYKPFLDKIGLTTNLAWFEVHIYKGSTTLWGNRVGPSIGNVQGSH